MDAKGRNKVWVSQNLESCSCWGSGVIVESLTLYLPWPLDTTSISAISVSGFRPSYPDHPSSSCSLPPLYTLDFPPSLSSSHFLTHIIQSALCIYGFHIPRFNQSQTENSIFWYVFGNPRRWRANCMHCSMPFWRRELSKHPLGGQGWCPGTDPPQILREDCDALISYIYC